MTNQHDTSMNDLFCHLDKPERGRNQLLSEVLRLLPELRSGAQLSR